MMEVHMAVSLSHLSASERHSQRTLEVLATAHTWAMVVIDGDELAYLVPSQSDDASYIVDLDGRCECFDSLKRIERGEPQRCKHGQAVLQFLAEQPIVDPFAETICSGCRGKSIYHMVHCPTNKARRAAADRRACESIQ
jgi:hypothetical protein